MSIDGYNEDELLALITLAWGRCQGWKGCKDGSFEMALANNGFYDACREADKRGIEWQHLTE